MVSSPCIEIYPDRVTLIQRAKDLMVERITQAIAQRGRCTLALAGGSTPKPLYQALATAPLPWENLHILWGDERYVPFDHPDNNAAMAYQAWLNHVPIPPEQIYPVPTHLDSVTAAAAAYDATARAVLGTDPIDIVLLGMGDDGHTASLFPHTAALAVTDSLATVGNKGDSLRVTLTAPALNHSRCVLFLVSGANKQTPLEAVLAPEGDAQEYPSRLIQPAGELWWLLDQEAGALRPH